VHTYSALLDGVRSAVQQEEKDALVSGNSAPQWRLLCARLRNARIPEPLEGVGWSYGTDYEYLKVSITTIT